MKQVNDFFIPGSDDYNRRFAAFLNNTDQGVKTNEALEKLFDALAENGALPDREVITLFDVGIGAGRFADGLTGIFEKLGKILSVGGCDISDAAIAAARDRFDVPRLHVADAFADEFSIHALNLGSPDIVLTAHTVYYALDKEMAARGDHNKVERFLKGLQRDLGPSSIAVLIHQSGEAIEGFKRTFSKTVEGDSTKVIARIARQCGLDQNTLTVTATKTVPHLYKLLRAVRAGTDIVGEIAESLAVAEFMGHTDTSKLPPQIRLKYFVDLEAIFKAYEQSDGLGNTPANSDITVISRLDAPETLKRSLAGSVRAVQSSLGPPRVIA